jgi:hypothetical protein
MTRKMQLASWGVLLSGAMAVGDRTAAAQASYGCGGDGSRVIATRWDAVLGRGWELQQDCAHPDWPARLVATSSRGATTALASQRAVEPMTPLLVRAGDSVRLWQQAKNVRIEMTGVAEQGARAGEPIMVRVVRQTDDAGQTVQRISGTVRGAGDVEMER